MSDYKYTLIVSQHSYSRHVFIVEHESRFVEQAQAFLDEIEPYKRDEGYTFPVRYGDLKDPYTTEGMLKPRHNVNDHGDVYFIHAASIGRLMHEVGHYKSEEAKEKIMYADEDYDDSRDIRNQIVFRRHDVEVVKDIVERHFHVL